MNTDIFKGTILEEVLNFNGQIQPILYQDRDLKNEKNYGSMSQLEKILYSMYVLKTNEQIRLAEKIVGKKFPNSRDSVYEFNMALTQIAQKSEITTLNQLDRESNFLFGMSTQMVKLRIPEITKEMRLYFIENYEIIAGEQNVIEIHLFPTNFFPKVDPKDVN